MKILVLLILLSTATAYADMPVKYPPKTLEMSKVDFYQWAANQNKQAQDVWTKKFNKGHQYNYGYRQIETTEVSGSSSGTSTITPLSVSQSPGRFSSTTRKQKQTIPYRYKNPDFRHPGSLTLINPFVQPKK